MNNEDFEIKIIDLHWIQNVDSPNDLCAHGHVFLRIGNQIISEKDTGDWTVSSTALSLLRTIENNYEKDENSNQLLPCCGFFLIADDEEETVIIQGCLTGIDWKIMHTTDNKVKHILDSGYEVCIDRDIYRNIVLDFADEVENFYLNSKEKNIPTDDFDRKGYLTFWKEWRKLRDKWK